MKLPVRLSSLTASQYEDRLYIFVTSALPDPYINVLVYALRHFNLGQIYFITVVEHGYVSEDDTEDKRLRAIVADVDRMLGQLAGGTYQPRPKDGRDELPVPIESAAAEMYEACLAKWERIENSSLVIPWHQLDARLREFVSDGHGIFDVTALKKNLLIDVTVLLLSRRCDRVFDFEILRKQRFFDHRDLIHELRENDSVSVGDFTYRNLTKTEYLRVAQRRMLARSLTFRTWTLVTTVVAAIVIVVQIFFPASWVETAVVAAASIAAISAWLFIIRDQ